MAERSLLEFLACPRCGERVDEGPGDRKENSPIPTTVKQIGNAPSPREAEIAYCPHCGAVLGFVP
jgi:Zn-finger nucleic acid-binding protein